MIFRISAFLVMSNFICSHYFSLSFYLLFLGLSHLPPGLSLHQLRPYFFSYFNKLMFLHLLDRFHLIKVVSNSWCKYQHSNKTSGGVDVYFIFNFFVVLFIMICRKIKQYGLEVFHLLYFQ